MNSKTCPGCDKTSYSAGEKPWICPYCGEDMSEVESNKEGDG